MIFRIWGIVSSAKYVEREVTIVNSWGLHAKTSFMLATLAKKFVSDIIVIKNNHSVDCKRIDELLTLMGACGETVTIAANGPDDKKAVEQLAKLIESGFESPGDLKEEKS